MPKPSEKTSERAINGFCCPWEGCEYTSESYGGVKIHHAKAHGESIGGGEVIECEYCGTEYREFPNRIERNDHNFCQTDCHDKWRTENVSGADAGGWEGGEVDVNCEWCGVEFSRPKTRVEQYNVHFCTRECYAEWMDNGGAPSGEDHPFYGVTGDDFHLSGEDNPLYGVTGSDHPAWKGGHDGDWRRGDAGEWRRVARKAYRRDGHTCQKCGESGELHAHHVTPVSDGGEKYELENIVTLCEGCHWDVHRAEYNGRFINRGEEN